MNPRKFALISGIFFLVVGILAFIPGLYSLPADASLPALNVENSYGLFLGFLPMNALNKIALIIIGFWGILAARAEFTSLPKSITYSRWVFALTGLLSILGMFSETNTLYGYAPLFGNQIWFYGFASLLGLYFGYALRMEARNVDDQEVPKRTHLQQNRPVQQH